MDLYTTTWRDTRLEEDRHGRGACAARSSECEVDPACADLNNIYAGSLNAQKGSVDANQLAGLPSEEGLGIIGRGWKGLLLLIPKAWGAFRT